MKSSRKRPVAVATLPHSWSLQKWPESIYPNDRRKARYVVRAHRDELMRAGALARVGRELIIFGRPYQIYLASQASRVDGFEIAPNRALAPSTDA
jgi:hypothetical protein